MEPILVIDFGTTYSCAALVTGDQVELIHEPSSGLLGWPSAVLVDGDDILVGSPADRRKVVRAPFYRSEVKRYLSRDESLDIGGTEYAPESLVSAVLAAFRAVADKVNGGPVAHAVLTKPADYLPGDPRNERMISAGETAGFSVVELLPEPVAAAYSAPVGEGFAAGSTVLVYDWGGGTFDTALVEILADGSTVLASDGLPYCGGADIDAAVARYLCEGEAELDPLFASGDKGRIAVLDLADRLKRELSERPDSLQEAMGIEAALTVTDFEKIAQPFVEQTVECCRGLLAAVGSNKVKLSAVFVAGGSSRIPLVGRMLQAEFGVEPRSARSAYFARSVIVPGPGLHLGLHLGLGLGLFGRNPFGASRSSRLIQVRRSCPYLENSWSCRLAGTRSASSSATTGQAPSGWKSINRRARSCGRCPSDGQGRGAGTAGAAVPGGAGAVREGRAAADAGRAGADQQADRGKTRQTAKTPGDDQDQPGPG